MGVEIVETIEAMLPKVDAVMLLSIDGRPHLAQVKPVLAARKPVFIDKPVAASLSDVMRIYDLARSSGTPCFSSSSLRFSPGIAAMRSDPRVGKVLGCAAFSSNAPLEPSHPDLFYYGIHGCELLFTIMGPGCQTVSRVKTPTADLAAGTWKDGRLGTFRGILKGQVGFGATVFGDKGIAPAGPFGGYEPLLVEIARFFRTGKPPVRAEETLEIYAFMEAADESKRQGGVPVSLESVLQKARAQVKGKSQQQESYFLPLPHGQGALRESFFWGIKPHFSFITSPDRFGREEVVKQPIHHLKACEASIDSLHPRTRLRSHRLPSPAECQKNAPNWFF